MRTSSRRFVALALGGLVFSSLACDNWESAQQKADRSVAAACARATEMRRLPSPAEESAGKALQNKITEKKDVKDPEVIAAAEKLTEVRKGAATQKLKAIVTELTKATGETAASTDKKIQARSMLGMTEFEIGDLFLGDLNLLRPRISSQIYNITQTAFQINSLNEAVKAAQLHDPKDVLAKIAEKRGEAATAAAAAATKISKLQADITKIQGELQSLTQQKDALIAQVDSDSEKASKLKPREASPVLDNVIENRRKAGNLGHQIDKVGAALLPLQRDLASTEALKKNLDATIASLDQNKTTVEANWQAVQKQIEEQKGMAAKLGEELNKQAVDLVKLEEEARQIRKNAVEKYEKAAKDYEIAAKDGKVFGAQMTTWQSNVKFKDAPEAKTWKQLQDLYNRSHFQLRQGQALHILGTIYAGQSELLAARQKMVAEINKPLTDAGLKVPDVLSGGDNDPGAAKTEAIAKYGDAIKLFEEVYEAHTLPPDFRTVESSAKISKMFSLFGDYILTGDAAKLTAARKAFDDAFQEKDSALAKSMPPQLRG